MGATGPGGFAAAILAALLLAGCSLTPDYVRPEAPLPSNFSTKSSAHVPNIAFEWWRAFGNRTLNALVAEANLDNADSAAALHRIEQARASYRIARSSRFPVIGVEADAALTRGNRDGAGKALSAVASLDQDLDVFGGNRAAAQAARATLAGRMFDFESIKLSVQADVASNYAALLLARDRRRISARTLGNSEQILKIADARFEAGAVSILDVVRQRSELARVRAAQALLLEDMRIAENALAVLIGNAAGTLQLAGGGLAALHLPVIDPGTPAALLYRRADVRRAEADLIAANADIGVARAALFPSLALNLEAAVANDPVTTSIAAGSSLLAPIFQGGRLRAGVRLSEARKAELVEAYRSALLIAMREVEDALAAVGSARRRYSDLAISLREARTVYEQSRIRYEAGTIDFQTVLDAQRTLFEAEDSLAVARFDRVIAVVQLIKALGGGWTANEPTS